MRRPARTDLPGDPTAADVRPGQWDRVAVLAILLGVAFRVVWGLVLHPPGEYVYSDMGGYVERARWLAAGGGPRRVDAFFPPGAHMLLAVPLRLFGPGQAGLWAGAALWCLLSGVTPFFAWRLARQLLTPAAAALSAAFCAFWPLYVTSSGFFTSETPSLTFLLGALWCGYRARRASGRKAVRLGTLAGLLGGVAVAIRPQFILNLAILAIPALRGRRDQAPALIGIALGFAVVVAGVLGYNGAAAGKPTGLSENSALNFWMGHCDVREVRTTDPSRNATFRFALPVPIQLHRGGSYSFRGRLVWDQPFFYDLGLGCIREDGIGHVRLLARNVLDATATTVPWPQVGSGASQRGVVQVSNLAYALLLPWIVIEALFLVRRRVAGPRSGEAVMLAHLACAAAVAVAYFGDPRIRSSYDVFGLALLAALVAARFGLDGTGLAGPTAGGPNPKG